MLYLSDSAIIRYGSGDSLSIVALPVIETQATLELFNNMEDYRAYLIETDHVPQPGNKIFFSGIRKFTTFPRTTCVNAAPLSYQVTARSVL